MISKLGYEVVVTKDGQETVSAYQEAQSTDMLFDVVIIDLTIPGGVGGQETLRRLKQIDPDIKAVVSSGFSNDPIMANYEAHGFQGIISKPYLIQDMSDVLQQVILN